MITIKCLSHIHKSGAVGCCKMQSHALSLYPLGIQPDSANNMKGGGSGTEEKHNFIVLVILLPLALSECVSGRKNEWEVQICLSLIPQVLLLA